MYLKLMAVYDRQRHPLSSKLSSSIAVSKKRKFETIFRYVNYFKFVNRCKRLEQKFYLSNGQKHYLRFCGRLRSSRMASVLAPDSLHYHPA